MEECCRNVGAHAHEVGLEPRSRAEESCGNCPYAIMTDLKLREEVFFYLKSSLSPAALAPQPPWAPPPARAVLEDALATSVICDVASGARSWDLALLRMKSWPLS